MTADSRPPFALRCLALLYLFSFMTAASSYGDPFPLMGRLHAGRAGEALIVADGIASLYLCIGIIKRQRLTLWFLIAYNLFDICNALVNMAALPQPSQAPVAAAVPAGWLRPETLLPALLLMLVNIYLLANRRLFNNRSPYLF